MLKHCLTNPLKKIKKKCVRTITFSEYLAPSEPIFQSLNVLNFEKLVVQRISLLMFKYTHGNVPVSVSQLFRTNNEYHNYNTRNCAHIHVPVGTTEASYRTFGYRGIYIWNHISQKININTSYPCFKNLVKIYIQNNNNHLSKKTQKKPRNSLLRKNIVICKMLPSYNNKLYSCKCSALLQSYLLSNITFFFIIIRYCRNIYQMGGNIMLIKIKNRNKK